MKELSILLIGVIAIFALSSYLRRHLYLDKVESRVNNKKYYVRKLPDKQEAADKIANIGIKLQKLIDGLDLEDKEKGKYSKQLKDRFNSDYITENIPGSDFVAYSVNKGDELSLCVREKDTEKFMDDNIIIFVAIHELAHIMTPEQQHTPLFWDNMKYLLEQGSSMGIYTPVDYSKNPEIYCGMEITSSPMKF
jgi:hypothetical protein